MNLMSSESADGMLLSITDISYNIAQTGSDIHFTIQWLEESWK